MLSTMEGVHLLMAQLLYGSGLRLMKSVRLRVQNFNFDNRQLSVRDGTDNKDRSTLFPEPLHGIILESPVGRGGVCACGGA